MTPAAAPAVPASAAALRARMAAGVAALVKRETVEFPEFGPDPATGEPARVEFRSMGVDDLAQLGERGMRDLTDAERDALKRQRAAWAAERGERPDAGPVEYRGNTPDFVPLLVLFSAYDPASGARLFADTAEDRAFVGAWPPEVMARARDAALRVNGMGARQADAMGNGSGGTPDATSGSTSPESSA